MQALFALNTISDCRQTLIEVDKGTSHSLGCKVLIENDSCICIYYLITIFEVQTGNYLLQSGTISGYKLRTKFL